MGRIVKDVCFRWELLHLDPEAVVTERLLAYIVEAGCLARIVLERQDDGRPQPGRR